MRSYLITADLSTLSKSLGKYRPAFALYRDKSNSEYKKGAIRFLELCRAAENTKTFLHQDYLLAKELGADGVHLTSTQFDRIEKAKSLGLEVTISTHTHEEVKKAQDLGADYVTYSPIFASPNKGKPKGIEDLQALVKKADIKVIALGGIVTKEHIKQVENANAYAFASIRYFEDLS
ncbi:MAG: thiamine phosphate synthase [Sulfurimonas sp.]